VFGLLLTPVFYVLIRRMAERKKVESTDKAGDEPAPPQITRA
jgi:hypothetical protein